MRAFNRGCPVGLIVLILTFLLLPAAAQRPGDSFDQGTSALEQGDIQKALSLIHISEPTRPY